MNEILFASKADFDTIAASAADIATVADNIANVNTVAGISANVTTVAGNSANVTTVAGISANVTTVAGISADVTTVAGVADDVSSVAALAYKFLFDASTSMADPGSGDVRFNNATPASVTAIAISNTFSGGSDVSDVIVTWDDSTTTATRGTLTFRRGGSPTFNMTFTITGAITDNTTWLEIPVAHVAGATLPTAADALFLSFSRTGDAGEVTGAASSTDNALARFNGTTGKIIQNSGWTLGDTDVMAGVELTLTTALVVASGGTGAATLTDGGILLGSGTGAITPMAVLADGSIVVGDGATDPVALAAFTSSTGTLKHEAGGLEFSAAAVADGDIIVGTGTGTMALRVGALTAGAAGFLKHELGGLEFDASGVVDGDFLVGTGTGTIGLESGATARASLGLIIGTDVAAFNAAALFSNATATLTVGFNATEFDAGTKSSGTYTPSPADGNFQKAVNGGAHTLAVPTTTCSIVIQYTNNASAGTITMSGFTEQTGESLTTTSGDDFLLYVTRVNGFSTLHVRALQ